MPGWPSTRWAVACRPAAPLDSRVTPWRCSSTPTTTATCAHRTGTDVHQYSQEGPPCVAPPGFRALRQYRSARFFFRSQFFARETSIIEGRALTERAKMIRVAIPETVLFRDLDGEAVLLATD